MRGLNKVILIGNLGKNPEIQILEGNIPVARFTLATSDIKKDKTGKTTSATEWHNIVAWRGLAEIAQKFLSKGSRVYVEGKLRTRSWDDKEGNKRMQTDVIAENIIMLDKKSDETQADQ